MDARMMNGIKYLFKRTFCHKIAVLITLIVAVGMMAAVIIFHEPLGADDDYLMCKLCAHLGSCFFMMISYIFLSAELNGNRAMRAIPFIRSLRLKAVPIYCAILGIGSSALINLIYAVYILVSKQELSNISDMMIVSLPVLVCYTVLGVIAMNINYGSILMIYLYLPLGGTGFFLSDQNWRDGFGLSVPVAVIIYTVTAVLCVTLAFVIARLFYYKAEFKAMPQANTPTM